MDKLLNFILSYGYIYLIIISLISVIVTVVDKLAAKFHKWRIPEKTLFILSILGGSVAMLLTMLLIRHKTRHKRFMIGIPLIIIIQIAILTFLFCSK